MRHGVKNNHLGRTTPHRKALLRNLTCQLIQHKRIVTTLAKAKALRIFVEPLLTKSKTDTTHQRRVVFSYLQNNDALKELFSVVNAKIANRPGGYTRIIKLDRRIGDAADMAMIELVDFNEIYNVKTVVGEEKKKTRRGRTAKTKTTDTTEKAPKEKVAKEEAPVVETAPVVENVIVEEVVATPAIEAVEETTAPVATVDTSIGDDLKKIEGIGPKIEEILKGKEITTFEKLAKSSVEELQTILAEAGGRFASHNPSTWSAQAEMAANGEFDKLKAWQDELNGGKVVE